MAEMIQIQIKGEKEMQAAFKKAPKITADILGRSIKRAIIRVEGRAIKKAPTDRGRLRNSFKTKFGVLSGELTNKAEYAAAVNDGTKPHFPPFKKGSSLEKWAKARGITPFLVARAISRKGTKAQPFFDDAVKESENDIDKEMEKGLEQITNKLAS